MTEPITSRAARPAATGYRIRLATEVEEITARKLHPDIEFTVLIMVSSSLSPDGVELRTMAIPYSLPADVELRLPTDPIMIEWIAQDRHTVLQMSDGQFELVGL